MLRAGDLREWIKFSSTSVASDGSGGGTTTTTDYLTTYAKVEEISSSPELLAGQEKVNQLIKIMIRFRKDLTIKNGDWAIWRGNQFIVNNIKVDPLRTFIEFIAHSNIETSKRES